MYLIFISYVSDMFCICYDIYKGITPVTVCQRMNNEYAMSIKRAYREYDYAMNQNILLSDLMLLAKQDFWKSRHLENILQTIMVQVVQKGLTKFAKTLFSKPILSYQADATYKFMTNIVSREKSKYTHYNTTLFHISTTFGFVPFPFKWLPGGVETHAIVYNYLADHVAYNIMYSKRLFTTLTTKFNIDKATREAINSVGPVLYYFLSMKLIGNIRNYMYTNIHGIKFDLRKFSLEVNLSVFNMYLF